MGFIFDCVHNEIKKVNTDHRHFIDSNQIFTDFAIVLSGKTASSLRRNKRTGAMDSLCGQTRTFSHTLRCASGRSHTKNRCVFLECFFVHFQTSAKRCTLTSTRTTCYDGDWISKIAYCFFLFFGKLNGRVFLPFCKSRIDFLLLAGSPFDERGKFACEIPFNRIIVFGINPISAFRRTKSNEPIVINQQLDRHFHQFVVVMVQQLISFRNQQIFTNANSIVLPT